jgi:hypothetical protein
MIHRVPPDYEPGRRKTCVPIGYYREERVTVRTGGEGGRHFSSVRILLVRRGGPERYVRLSQRFVIVAVLCLLLVRVWYGFVTATGPGVFQVGVRHGLANVAGSRLSQARVCSGLAFDMGSRLSRARVCPGFVSVTGSCSQAWWISPPDRVSTDRAFRCATKVRFRMCGLWNSHPDSLQAGRHGEVQGRKRSVPDR